MRFRLTAFALAAFAIGALSDVLLIRNGFSYSGLTLLDKYPAIWPGWLTFIFLCSFLLDFKLQHSRAGHSDPSAPGPSREFAGSHGLPIPLAILLGMIVTHTTLLIRDLIADPTSHNLWPFEYLFWTIVVAAPACLGSILARVIAKVRR